MACPMCEKDPRIQSIVHFVQADVQTWIWASGCQVLMLFHRRLKTTMMSYRMQSQKKRASLIDYLIKRRWTASQTLHRSPLPDGLGHPGARVAQG